MAAATLRLAVLQLAVGASKAANLAAARQQIAAAAAAGAQMVLLPECFNCPYGNKYFPEYAEPADGETAAALRDAARLHSVYVFGGSFPERDGDKLFNTCLVFGPDGALLGRHRKIHLFDIDIPGRITFRESETLTAGDAPTIVETPYGRVGVGICYDLRFADLAAYYAEHDCMMIVYPGAFNMTTGPAHWELLQRGRAVDNQLFIATASPARDEAADYIAWGHSSVVDPWGVVVERAGAASQLVLADIDTSAVQRIRAQIPVRVQGRPHIYPRVKAAGGQAGDAAGA